MASHDLTAAVMPCYLLPRHKLIMWLGRQGSNLGMPESKSGALPLGDAPIIANLFI